MTEAESGALVFLAVVSPWQPGLILGTGHAQKMRVEQVHLHRNQARSDMNQMVLHKITNESDAILQNQMVLHGMTHVTQVIISHCLWETSDSCSDRFSLSASLSASLECSSDN